MIHQIKHSQEKKKRDENYPILLVTHFTAHSLFQIPIKDFCEFCLTELKPLSSQGTMMPSSYGVILISLILLLFLATEVTSTEPTSTHAEKVEEEPPFVPVIEASKLKTLVMNETRRKLGSFQICALCTCCGGAKGLCLPSPCCYAINCNIPNRPFGFCSFTPKTCNCFGCHY